MTLLMHNFNYNRFEIQLLVKERYSQKRDNKLNKAKIANTNELIVVFYYSIIFTLDISTLKF